MWWRRPDGDLVKDLPLNRRAMPYLMKGRNESAFYYEYDISLRKADAFIRAFNQANPATPIDVFHLSVFALRDLMRKYPTMNRFVAGGRLYQRRDVWLSYAVKRKLQLGAPMVVVKRRFPVDESFTAMVAGMQAQLHEDRFGGPGFVDKELALLMKFPGFARRILLGLVDWGNRLGMLPKSYIEKDPMFATAFLANLGSLGMDAGFHHLYEYGTSGVFCAVGRPRSDPGSPTSGPDRRRTVRVCWTFDERTEDGFTSRFALRHFKSVLEDPEAAGLWSPDAPEEAAEPAAVAESTEAERADGAALS